MRASNAPESLTQMVAVCTRLPTLLFGTPLRSDRSLAKEAVDYVLNTIVVISAGVDAIMSAVCRFSVMVVLTMLFLKTAITCAESERPAPC
jgi:hypothetical protein